ncbi:orotate phosphoribosyltransferase [Sulfuriferula multivorans]|uniref:Orotate phosphoribosyltransferase n=1 Tax=Sulfuriferula multivorans TaxID=1559896 RepID=A0A401JDJ7_9PROT|nr:orotate phosphoribosyltransferase [Sulfuriferula multivorans]GBL45664.1 orotate phosphoribosyltransferase [Sulfuriferula multivorans]
MSDFRQAFLSFAIEQNVLCFGEFKTKAGRISPYFFNAGLFADGMALKQLGEFYAKAIRVAGIKFDVLFGPAYKGIPLAATTVVALAAQGQKVPYSFNRKEAKDHGEGGTIVGAPLHGRVLIIDDVISAGTSVRESVELIRSHGATPAGVVIALDRMERGQGTLSAVQEVQAQYGIPVFAIASLGDLLAYLHDHPNMEQNLQAVARYREVYGVT